MKLPQVAKLLQRRGVFAIVLVCRILLLLLYTRLGTLMLCGSSCFRKSWPFISSFSEIPVQERALVVRKWFRNKWFPPLRCAVLFMKVICLYNFFSRADENGDSKALKAIGYEIKKERDLAGTAARPLDKGVIETYKETEHSLLQKLTDKKLHVDEDDSYNIHCDAVVVGSGCGGAVAAAVLAGAGYKVVVVEKGNYFAKRDFSHLEGPSVEQMYESGGILSTVNGTVMILAGSAVGGGSLVNWSACIDPPGHVTREWSDRGLSFFESEEFREAVEVVKRKLGVTDGCSNEGFQNRVLRTGCESLGLEVGSVARNSTGEHHCGLCLFGCPTGEKKGTDVTWLVDAVNDGAVILTGCNAEKLVLQENKDGGNRKVKCTGVIVKIGNKTIPKRLKIHAKVTVAAAGALRTPPLLLSSGLRNKNIGNNLHLHPVLMAWGYFPESESNLEGRSYEGGIITSVHRVCQPDDSVSAIIETPGLGPGSFAALWPWRGGEDMKDAMMRYGRIAHLIVLVRDKGSGSVSKRREIRYRVCEEDKEDLTAGLRRALRILIGAGAVEVGTHGACGRRLACRGVGSEEVEEFLGSVAASEGPLMADDWVVYCSAHQMGSCRMGVDPKEGAVDANGHSWEAEGLFVCDASVLPTALGVNPMITLQSTSYCVANRILQHLASL